MTRHNLSQHLTWLIGSNPLHPPQPIFTPPSTATPSASEPTLEDPPPPLVIADSIPRLSRPQVTFKDAPSQESKTEFTRPSVPASFLNTYGTEAMARLQSGPRSGHKPRLLSASTLPSVRTPSVSVPRPLGHSLTEHYTAKWEQSPLSTSGLCSRGLAA